MTFTRIRKTLRLSAIETYRELGTASIRFKGEGSDEYQWMSLTVPYETGRQLRVDDEYDVDITLAEVIR